MRHTRASNDSLGRDRCFRLRKGNSSERKQISYHELTSIISIHDRPLEVTKVGKEFCNVEECRTRDVRLPAMAPRGLYLRRALKYYQSVDFVSASPGTSSTGWLIAFLVLNALCARGNLFDMYRRAARRRISWNSKRKSKKMKDRSIDR
jgi:hypothetical protein